MVSCLQVRRSVQIEGETRTGVSFHFPTQQENEARCEGPTPLPMVVGKFVVHLYDHSLIKIRVLSAPAHGTGIAQSPASLLGNTQKRISACQMCVASVINRNSLPIWGSESTQRIGTRTTLCCP